MLKFNFDNLGEVFTQLKQEIQGYDSFFTNSIIETYETITMGLFAKEIHEETYHFIYNDISTNAKSIIGEFIKHKFELKPFGIDGNYNGGIGVEKTMTIRKQIDGFSMVEDTPINGSETELLNPSGKTKGNSVEIDSHNEKTPQLKVNEYMFNIENNLQNVLYKIISAHILEFQTIY